jgi:hypothetical protein
MRQVMEKGQRFTVASLVAVVFLWLLSLPLIQFTWTVVETWVQFHLDKGEPFSIGRWLDATTLALALAGPIVLLLSAIGVLAAIRSEWPRWPVLAVSLWTGREAGFTPTDHIGVCAIVADTDPRPSALLIDPRSPAACRSSHS